MHCIPRPLSEIGPSTETGVRQNQAAASKRQAKQQQEQTKRSAVLVAVRFIYDVVIDCEKKQNNINSNTTTIAQIKNIPVVSCYSAI